MANQITPPPSDVKPAEASAPEAQDSSSGKRKYLKFVGTKKISPSHRAGSHYHITEAQLVEAGVPRERCFKSKGSGKDAIAVTEVTFGPETQHKVPLDAFYKEAADRLLQEPDIILVEE
ncbi:hypothetical protein PBI_THOTH_22 [Mycobacterium phage Thoth]|nr:hypothetical protein PBI_THOTH_22 [Mycobacterium phage Thoth]